MDNIIKNATCAVCENVQDNAIPKKDNRELLTHRRKSLLKSLTTAGIASIAPLLYIARSPETEEIAGMVITTKVLDVKILDSESNKVVLIHTLTNQNGISKKEKVENVVYIFRGFSPQAFEPFVCINRDSNSQWILAYANDEEFLMEKIDGDEKFVLSQVITRANEQNMGSLKRLTDLIKQLVELQG